MNWEIPRIWEDETVYLFGGGPSLLSSIAEYDFSDHYVIGANNSFLLRDVDILYFGDAKFYWWNEKEIQTFKGLKITSDQGIQHGNKSVNGQHKIKVVKIGKYKGLESRSNRIGWNRSSGAAAINVAIHLGAKKIVLLGYDMRVINGHKNWMVHEKEQTNQNPYDYMLVGFTQVARQLGRFNCSVVNATPKSKIEVFPMVELKELF